jgi:hypothetical protein
MLRPGDNVPRSFSGDGGLSRKLPVLISVKPQKGVFSKKWLFQTYFEEFSVDPAGKNDIITE